VFKQICDDATHDFFEVVSATTKIYLLLEMTCFCCFVKAKVELFFELTNDLSEIFQKKLLFAVLWSV
jgi:hypothetical protein